MEYIEKLKKLLCKELDEYAQKTKMSAGDLDVIHKLTDTVKNLDKIEMLEQEEGYSEGSNWMGEGRMYGTSYARNGRGRGRNAKRDSMGRYSRDDGYSENYYPEDNGSSYARGGENNRGSSYRGGYSRNDAKDMMMEQIEEMMENAENPKEREALHRCMMSLKNA